MPSLHLRAVAQHARHLNAYIFTLNSSLGKSCCCRSSTTEQPARANSCLKCASLRVRLLQRQRYTFTQTQGLHLLSCRSTRKPSLLMFSFTQITPCGLSMPVQRCSSRHAASSQKRAKVGCTHLQKGDHVVVDEVANHPLHPHAIVRVGGGRERLQPDLMEVAAVAERAQVAARLRYEMLYRLHHVHVSEAAHEQACSNAPNLSKSVCVCACVRACAAVHCSACACQCMHPHPRSTVDSARVRGGALLRAEACRRKRI